MNDTERLDALESLLKDGDRDGLAIFAGRYNVPSFPGTFFWLHDIRQDTISDDDLSGRGASLREVIDRLPSRLKPGPTQARLFDVIRSIYERTEGLADGAPDASPRDQLANEIAGICREILPREVAE